MLSGYPLQNNLSEYWCMIDFVRPSYLGTHQDFVNMFVSPIYNGQCVDSTQEVCHSAQQHQHVHVEITTTSNILAIVLQMEHT